MFDSSRLSLLSSSLSAGKSSVIVVEIKFTCGTVIHFYCIVWANLSLGLSEEWWYISLRKHCHAKLLASRLIITCSWPLYGSRQMKWWLAATNACGERQPLRECFAVFFQWAFSVDVAKVFRWSSASSVLCVFDLLTERVINNKSGVTVINDPLVIIYGTAITDQSAETIAGFNPLPTGDFRPIFLRETPAAMFFH